MDIKSGKRKRREFDADESDDEERGGGRNLKPQISNLLIFKESSSNNSNNCPYLRQRLVLSLLSSRPVKIQDIRSRGGGLLVGLRPHEVSFIQLLMNISNGSEVKISETGTSVYFKPGLIVGSFGADESVNHFECDDSRPISYYLEPLLILAPFSKKPFNIVLQGRFFVHEEDERMVVHRSERSLFKTKNGGPNDEENPIQLGSSSSNVNFASVYKIKHAALPIMERFGLEPQIEILELGKERIKVKFRCNIKKQLMTLRKRFLEEPSAAPKNGRVKVKKVRGSTFSFGGLTAIAPQLLHRVMTSAKQAFLPLINDVYITLDSSSLSNSANRIKKSKKGQNNPPQPQMLMNLKGKGQNREGESPEETKIIHSKGYGISLYAQTTTGIVYSAEAFTDQKSQVLNQKSPEEVGLDAARNLMYEISRRTGEIDTSFQWLVLGYMALGPKDVSSVILGKSISPFTVQFLRDLKTFFGVTFKIDELKIQASTKEEKDANVIKSIDKQSESDEDGDNSEDEDDEEDSDLDENDNDSDLSDSNKEDSKPIEAPPPPISSFTVYQASCLGSGYINLNKTNI